MAFRQFVLSNGTAITVYKHRASRSLRISIRSDGKIRVTIPMWATYGSGVRFAESRISWLDKHHEKPALIQNNQAAGKAHHIHFVQNYSISKITTRVKDNDIVVNVPLNLPFDSSEAQAAAKKAAVRALRQEAEQLLPQRLQQLATKHGFIYSSVSVKALKGRWGSCDHQKNVVFNLYLMQLPWDLIDYVILHELTHTNVMKHGPDFWAAMVRVLPDVNQKRKHIKQFQPTLGYRSDDSAMA
jgi:predicted metal-dependent hydrolase